ncbi:hypothetical protein AMECASPLE_018904 [Ameca splendens]|uniref:Secreted protein n=1 Tax=Ameca splendens TaxID=208324 RepID=A0ABV0YEG6_9TELE
MMMWMCSLIFLLLERTEMGKVDCSCKKNCCLRWNLYLVWPPAESHTHSFCEVVVAKYYRYLPLHVDLLGWYETEMPCSIIFISSCNYYGNLGLPCPSLQAISASCVVKILAEKNMQPLRGLFHHPYVELGQKRNVLSAAQKKVSD